MDCEGAFPLFVLMVKFRHEKAILSALSGKGYESYLPLARQIHIYSGRVRSADVPLFPTYVFARFDPLHRLPILMTPGVFGIVGNRDGPLAVDEEEFRSIRLLGNSRLHPEHAPFGQRGDPVLVIAGPLAGATGTLLSVKNRQRLILSITLLQRSLSVEVDASAVQRLKSPEGASSARTLEVSILHEPPAVCLANPCAHI
jgi:transcription antitermination factor NusG